MNRRDMTGLRFGKLTVLEESDTRAKSGQSQWVCACDCGGQTVTQGSNLRSGRATSCGCAIGDANRERLTTHGQSKTHPLYETWVGIRQRCLNPSNHAYHRYGGRGISISPLWADDFERFAADVGERPEGMSLDRIDNDGSYEPGNVRWATAKTQANNRGPSKAALVAEVERQGVIIAALEGLAARWDEFGPESEAERVFGKQVVSVEFAVTSLQTVLATTSDSSRTGGQL